jgi:hypothetical protein
MRPINIPNLKRDGRPAPPSPPGWFCSVQCVYFPISESYIICNHLWTHTEQLAFVIYIYLLIVQLQKENRILRVFRHKVTLWKKPEQDAKKLTGWCWHGELRWAGQPAQHYTVPARPRQDTHSQSHYSTAYANIYDPKDVELSYILRVFYTLQITKWVTPAGILWETHRCLSIIERQFTQKTKNVPSWNIL